MFNENEQNWNREENTSHVSASPSDEAQKTYGQPSHIRHAKNARQQHSFRKSGVPPPFVLMKIIRLSSLITMLKIY